MAGLKPRSKKDRWPEILKSINEKRTHEQEFRVLFAEILEDKKDPCHQRLTTLSMLYDFTPLPIALNNTEQITEAYHHEYGYYDGRNG